MKDADAVFLGSVERFEVRGNPKVERVSRVATFTVRTVWKGSPQPKATVFTGWGGGDCGFDFIVGHEYLVYAYQNPDGYNTGICTRTRDIGFWENAKEDFAVLGQGISVSE